MSSNSFPKSVLGMIILGPIMVIIFKNWNSLPFNQHSKMVERIEVVAESYDPKLEILSVRIINKNHHDISNIDTRCQFMSKNGNVVSEINQVWFATVFADAQGVSRERVPNISLQADKILCTTIDAKRLDMYKGKEFSDPNAINASTRPFARNK